MSIKSVKLSCNMSGVNNKLRNHIKLSNGINSTEKKEKSLKDAFERYYKGPLSALYYVVRNS